MKSAIYLNEGVTQVVLTPENQWEKNALRMIESSGNVSKCWGGFYECRGGWYRENQCESSNDSLIFRIDAFSGLTRRCRRPWRTDDRR